MASSDQLRDGIIRAIEAQAAGVIYAVLFLFVFTTVFPFFHEIPKENQQLISTMVSTVQNVVLIIIAFFFGQSSGNLKKDSTIDRLVRDTTPTKEPDPDAAAR